MADPRTFAKNRAASSSASGLAPWGEPLPVDTCSGNVAEDNCTLLDGSELEGGGQLLRNAFALSALLCKPVRVTRVRAGRDRPGLRTQHLLGIQLVARMCNGTLVGDELHSCEVSMVPKKEFSQSDSFLADTKTAGSTCLLIQIILPCCLFTARRTFVKLCGGTNAAMAPQLDYFEMVFRPVVASGFGFSMSLHLLRRGFFPRGGGEVVLETEPIEKLRAVNLTTRGRIDKVHIYTYVCGLVKPHVAVRMQERALKQLRQCAAFSGASVECSLEVGTAANSIGQGCFIILTAHSTTGCILAGSAIGRKGAPAETIAEEAVQDLVEDIEVGGCVDRHLQDQMIIFMALADGFSMMKSGPLELHTKTAIRFAALLTGARFEVLRVQDPNAKERLTTLGYVAEESDVPNTMLVCCEGVALQNRHEHLDKGERSSKYLSSSSSLAHAPGSLARPTAELVAELKAAGVDTDGHETRKQQRYAHNGSTAGSGSGGGGSRGRNRRQRGGKRR